MDLQPIESAPDDGSEFIAVIGGLPYLAKYDEHGRFVWYMHTDVSPGEAYQNCVIEGVTYRKMLSVQAEPKYEVTGLLWKRGFEFKPTHWMPVPKKSAAKAHPPAPEVAQQEGGAS